MAARKRNPNYSDYYTNLTTEEVKDIFYDITTQELICAKKKETHKSVMESNKAKRKELTFYDYFIPVTGCGLLLTLSFVNPVFTLFASIFSFFFLESRFKLASTLYHKVASNFITRQENNLKLRREILKSYSKNKNANLEKAEEEAKEFKEGKDTSEEEVKISESEEEKDILDEKEKEIKVDEKETDKEVKDPNLEEEKDKKDEVKSTDEKEVKVDKELGEDEKAADILSELYQSTKDSSSNSTFTPPTLGNGDGGKEM